eukprot:gnl/MRDRNA2_/MRDRNA2_93026_c0_seq1.p1 gnl/MRDRNA2_/MRDRNA2_93026_c0~~gnl/MRDRNA2_/MRDRNA2_93026_c0_seq1.p1  ORF type:complete len:192 (+),score=56.12 gnl/MRDRNA2_/MRDRNA2_93026_c0_seq1:78-578(+)
MSKAQPKKKVKKVTADMFEHNDQNETLTEEEKADGWTYGDMTKAKQVEEFGYVAEDMYAFYCAVKDGAIEYVDEYIRDKMICIDVDFYDAMGVTLLQWAAIYGYKDVCESLLKAKADPSLKDLVENMTAYEMAKRELDEKDEKATEEEQTKKKEKYEPIVALLRNK